jgi:hypothetical protein
MKKKRQEESSSQSSLGAPRLRSRRAVICDDDPETVSRSLPDEFNMAITITEAVQAKTLEEVANLVQDSEYSGELPPILVEEPPQSHS